MRSSWMGFVSIPNIPRVHLSWSDPPFPPAAHISWKRRRRPVPVVTRLLPGGLPHGAVHRVQRGQRHMPLLCQQIQLLADDHEPGLPLPAGVTDTKSRPAPFAHQPLPSLHEEPVRKTWICLFVDFRLVYFIPPKFCKDSVTPSGCTVYKREVL